MDETTPDPVREPEQQERPAQQEKSAQQEQQAEVRGEALPASLASRLAIAGAIAVVAVGVMVHLAMVFLHVAPSNTLTKQHSDVIDDYVYPEFEQNWKLFAPNPLQQNIAVHARAEVRLPDGKRITTGWVDLTAQDIAAIKHNPAPSHINQNMLRRAWDFYTGSHDDKDKAFGQRGEISEVYVRRIVSHRFGPKLNGGRVLRIQVRSATTLVAPPKWSNESANTQTSYRELPWWPVDKEDFQ